MEITTQKIKGPKVKLTITLDKEDLAGYTREAEKRLANDLKVNGFREGKVPPDIARKKIGHDVIKKEAFDLAVKQSMTDAISREGVDPIEYEDLKIKESLPDKLVYELSLLVFPEVELGEYKNLKINIRPIEVKHEEVKEEVKNAILQLQKSRAKFETSLEPAQRGDRVEIDFRVKMGDEELEGGKGMDHPLIIGEDGFVAGFSENIIGLKTGEEKSFSINVPADYHQEQISGKTIDCNVTVKKISKVILPDLNDDFAKMLGAFESMEDVKKSMEGGLNMEKQEKEKERRRIYLLEQVAEKSKLELPEILVKRQLEAMISSFDHELHQKGMELGPYLMRIKKTEEELKKDWQGNAAKQVRLALITKEIAKREKIGASEEEVEAEFEAAAQQFIQSGGAINNEDEVEKLKKRISDILVNEKVFEFIEKSATLS